MGKEEDTNHRGEKEGIIDCFTPDLVENSSEGTSKVVIHRGGGGPRSGSGGAEKTQTRKKKAK